MPSPKSLPTPSILRRIRNRLPLPSISTNDRQVLIVCIILSFVFWLILNLSQTYSITKEVRLTYLINPDRVLAGSPPRNMPVVISGEGWNLLLESFRGKTIDVEIDMFGESNYQLTAAELSREIRRRLSSGALEIRELAYESQRVLTTPLTGKTVPVVAHVRVDYAPGYFSPDVVRVFPDSVTVSGATDELESVVVWPTEPLLLDDVDQEVDVTVGLQRPPEGFTLNYEEVRISFNVQAFIERTFRVPLTLINAPVGDSLRVFPDFVTVTASLPQAAYTEFSQQDFTVEVDLNRMITTAGGNTLPVALTRVPEALHDVRYSPRSVEYYIYTGASSN